MKQSWHTKPFEELTLHELHDLMKLRVDVFVVEQNCPYPELDGLDLTALHLFARQPDGPIMACARILPPGTDGLPHIGRVLVRQEFRGKGIASTLMDQALSALQQQYGSRRSALAAQAHLEHFYARFGFVREGPDYALDGIPHVDMRREED